MSVSKIFKYDFYNDNNDNDKTNFYYIIKELIFYLIIIFIFYIMIYYLSLFLGGLVANLIIIH
jgi:hypothetical protein